ncbi:hypothetical protein BJY04DRAFT_199820 [Aspergillus karnatakaensis]|uniref:uncharacterized protein n=1 Tax=Aspergillus karnatakaensis TaxID=1810916 RepID=UPI003CCD4C4C
MLLFLFFSLLNFPLPFVPFSSLTSSFISLPILCFLLSACLCLSVPFRLFPPLVPRTPVGTLSLFPNSSSLCSFILVTPLTLISSSILLRKCLPSLPRSASPVTPNPPSPTLNRHLPNSPILPNREPTEKEKPPV